MIHPHLGPQSPPPLTATVSQRGRTAADVQRLQRASGLNQEIVKMFSNDPRLTDLVGFKPDAVEFKRTSDADLSRRAGRRRRR